MRWSAKDWSGAGTIGRSDSSGKFPVPRDGWEEGECIYSRKSLNISLILPFAFGCLRCAPAVAGSVFFRMPPGAAFSGFPGAGEDAADKREKLLFPADHPVHFKEVRGEVGKVDFVNDGGVAGGEEEAVVAGDVGDDQAGKVAFAALSEFGQTLAEVIGPGFEVLQAEFLDLADADAPAVLHEFLAVGIEDDLAGAGAEEGAGGEEVAGELRDHNASLSSQPGEYVAVGAGGGRRGREGGMMMVVVEEELVGGAGWWWRP